MQVGPLFNKLRTCPKKYVVVQGGGDAAKTITILQHLGISAVEALTGPEIITVTAQDTPNLRVGALRAFENYVASDNDIYPYIQSYHKTDRIYTLKNKGIIEFKGFENEQTARGSERTRLFLNEANSRTYNLFWQLQRKTRKQVLIDYNPSSIFWVNSKVLPGPDQEKQFRDKTQRYIVDHRHNPFLTEEEHEAYESISDPELFRVYSRGLTGKVTGLIFGHFKKVESFPEDIQRFFWGIDYGYTNDPTALIKVGAKGRQRYGKECCYEPGISAERIKELLIINGWQDGQIIYSEVDSNMITQLRILGLPVYPAIKGPGSEAASISKVKEYECFYTADSVNFEKEINTWKWMTAEDIQTGKQVMTNVPIKGHDHACDGFRYACYTDSFVNR